MKACDLPPLGWTCSREIGHEGPCAASQWNKPPTAIWSGKFLGMRVHVLNNGERVIDATDFEAFLARTDEEAMAYADGLTGPPWPEELYRREGETEEAFLARVTPFLEVSR